MTNEQKLAELARLETVIANGLLAYEARNRLIVQLVEQGTSQAEVTRRLNKVREKMQVATLSPCAVPATLRRAHKEK